MWPSFYWGENGVHYGAIYGDRRAYRPGRYARARPPRTARVSAHRPSQRRAFMHIWSLCAADGPGDANSNGPSRVYCGPIFICKSIIEFVTSIVVLYFRSSLFYVVGCIFAWLCQQSNDVKIFPVFKNKSNWRFTKISLVKKNYSQFNSYSYRPSKIYSSVESNQGKIWIRSK